MPNFRSEKGATLVELLAALVLVTFVGAVAYTFLINSFLFQERSEERVNLVQESNLLAAELSSLHDKGAIIYLDDDGVLYEGSNNEGRELLAQSVTTDGLSFNNQVLEPGSVLDLDGDRYEFNSELQSGGYTHTLQFTSNNVGAYTYIADEETDEDNENGEEEPPLTPEDISFPDENELGEKRKFSSSECIFYGNTNHESRRLASWEACEENTNVDGNLHFNYPETNINYSSENGENFLTVQNGSLFISNALITNGRPGIKVDHSFYVGGNAELRSNTVTEIDGSSVIRGNLLMQENASLQTDSLNVTGTMDFTGTPKLNVLNDAVFSNGLQTDNSPDITVGGNITVNGPIRLRSGGSPQMIEIGGNAFFEGNLNYQQAVNLAVTGDMLVTGNIGNEISWDAGRLCVQGDLQVNGRISEPIRVNTSASSCDGIPVGEIRVLGNFSQ